VLAWVLAVPGVTAVIVGRRGLSQLDDWLQADALGLDGQTLP
jgi:aryl-alcohol dehydrogenase-like predicted oxidoreductase